MGVKFSFCFFSFQLLRSCDELMTRWQVEAECSDSSISVPHLCQIFQKFTTFDEIQHTLYDIY
uniref:Putative ovule protein n=1 Tax=Solanum chacoense TaxID=4108 RepID=A0A0V0GG04_SOLCH